MEITYILLGEILGILLLFQFFSSWIVISITLFSLGTVYFFTKKKSILIYMDRNIDLRTEPLPMKAKRWKRSIRQQS